MSKVNIEPIIFIGNSQNQKFHNLSYLTLAIVNSDYELSANELIFKATQWAIPIPYYDGDIDFPVLENRVCEYESLVNRAAELGIRFDLSNYSPAYLSCIIEDKEMTQLSADKNYHRRYC